MITIVGLGVRAGDLTLEGMRALSRGGKILLRTEITPAADFLRDGGIPFESLDALYERTEDYDEVNDAIARAVLDAAEQCDVTFGVIGGAGLMDASVKCVTERAAQAGIDVRVIPGVGLYEYAAGQAGGLDGACVTAAIDLDKLNLDVRRPLIVCELNDRVTASECKLTLQEHYPDAWEVTLDGRRIPLEELDRQAEYSHLTALVVPPLALLEAERYDFAHLVEIVERLRRPDGCPWDREQTHQSMKADLLEEAYEVIDAIDGDDPYRLADELGDLLLNVAMHAQIGSEHGEFDITDVLWAVCHKMITRHPHVFGDVKADTSEQVLANWEVIKKGEKRLATQTDVMRDIPRCFPALMRAAKVQKKARSVGFDWDDAREALKKVREEADEAEQVWDDADRLFSELGDLLFAAVNVCRMKKVPPELALERATDKFIRRFSYVERTAGEQGKRLQDMTLAEMDALWEQCKALERK
ncbi:MAG: nucleoside triphosphate pyrophosphohydrolase [Candidatus Spyradocola sp.]